MATTKKTEAKNLFAAINNTLGVASASSAKTNNGPTEWAWRNGVKAVHEIRDNVLRVKTAKGEVERVLRPGKLVERVIAAVKFGVRPACFALHCPDLKTRFEWKAVASEIEAAAKAKGADAKAVLIVLGVVPDPVGTVVEETEEVKSDPKAALEPEANKKIRKGERARHANGERDAGTKVVTDRETSNGATKRTVLSRA